MKRAATPFIVLIVTGLLLISCGGGSNPNPSTSGIKKRAFITVTRPDPLGVRSYIQIIDAAADTESFFTIPAGTPFSGLGSNPTLMVLSSDKKTTFVVDASGNAVYVLDNAKEDVVAKVSGLPSWTESLAVSSDAKTAWAAVRNAPVTGAPTGAIQVLDIANAKISAQIPVPLVHFVALSHDGKKLLAFSDQSDSIAIVDTTSNTVTASVAGFDRPVQGFFTSDDSKAYILNCGAECGGATASVQVLDLTTNTAGAALTVSGATTGLINGTALFVAGTTSTGGRLDVVDLTAFTVTKSGVPIGDGYHGPIALGPNNKLFVGAKNCTNLSTVPGSGCLTIFDTSAQTVVVPEVDCSTAAPSTKQCGPVTSLQPIADRKVVYVIQNGELVIYDATTSAPQSTQIDIVGSAFDVRTVD